MRKPKTVDFKGPENDNTYKQRIYSYDSIYRLKSTIQ